MVTEHPMFWEFFEVPPEPQQSPQERFAAAQQKYEQMQRYYSGNINNRDMVYAEYEAAWLDVVTATGHEEMCLQYWLAGSRFFQHVVTLESIKVSPLSSDHLQDTLKLWREFQAAEAAVAHFGFNTVSIEDWRKAHKSPFEHHVVTPIFHLFPKKRDADQPVRLYADEYLQSAQAAGASTQ